MNWPDFLIVGAAKAGTTSLYHYLKQHPDIFMPKIKEPSFFSFADEYVEFVSGKPAIMTSLRDYEELFRFGAHFKCKGEASTPYLYFYSKSISNIKKYVPEYQKIRIVIILRNPIDRAYSQYMNKVRDLLEPLTFEKAIEREKVRMEQNVHFDFFYIDRGFYYKQVKSYIEAFRHVKIVLFDDLRSDMRSLVEDIMTFLGVRPGVRCNTSYKHNVSGVPRVKGLQNLFVTKNMAKIAARKLFSEAIRKRLYVRMINIAYRFNLKKVEMAPRTRKYLTSLYEQDINRLSNLIDRDLSSWLDCA